MTLVWRPGWNGLTEPEAVEYVAAVEAADGQELEFGVAKAINDFVLGCKNDGIWPAIKASCILAGARTLAGALVPLIGSAPSKQGTEAGWNYNRKTGLQGNGTDNYLDSNRNNNADPQNSQSMCVFFGATYSGVGAHIGTGAALATGATHIINGTTDVFFRNRSSTSASTSGAASAFVGMSRNSSANYTRRINGTASTESTVSETPALGNVYVFARNASGSPNSLASSRLAFYSIGESLDLALLDARVSALITAIGAAF
jgi:hypothetical protein